MRIHMCFSLCDMQNVPALKLTAFGGYTRPEIEMLGTVFLEFDLDGDNTISYLEFTRVANSKKHGKVPKMSHFSVTLLVLECACYRC